MKVYTPKSLKFARVMRKKLTPAEARLWFGCLKELPFKFYRQRPVGKYILDFYCAEANLAIELDGDQHYFEKGIKHDEERTKYLETKGIKVLRIGNIDVYKNLDGVGNLIYYEIAGRISRKLEDYSE